MRFCVSVCLVSLILILPAALALAVGLPAGTTFQVQAEATYEDTEGALYSADPVAVTLTVAQVAGVSVQGNGQIGQASPGQDFYVPIKIVNTGNWQDRFNLTATSSKGWPAAIVYDENGDGQHQSGEQNLVSQVGLVIADGYSPCFAKVTVPSGATSGGTVTVTAISVFDPTGTDQTLLSVDLSAAPTVAISTPTSNSTYTITSPSINLGGTASSGATLTEVEWSTNRGASGTCTGTSSWTASGIALQPGANIITVTVTDSSGRTATDTITVTYNDITSPSITITNPVTGASYTTTSSPLNISGTASDSVGVTSVKWSNSRGGSGTCTGTTSWSASGIALSAGQNVITVTASDAAANHGTDVLTVTYNPPDTTAPTVTIASPTTAATYVTSLSHVTVSGTATDNVLSTSVSWSNSRGGSGTCTGTTSWSAGSIALSAGDNVITITASDEAENHGTAVLRITYNAAETVAPDVTIAGPTSAATYTTDDSYVALSGAASDNVGVASVSWTNDRGGFGICTGTTTWAVGAVALSAGQNVITITAFDTSNNAGSAVLTITYEPVETVAPTVAIDSPTIEGIYTTANSAISVAGSASDNVGVTSVAWSNDRGGSGACAGTANWVASGIALSAGQNVITITASDAANNTGVAVLTVTYEPVETVPPTVTITSPTTAATYTTTDPSINVAGTASDNVGVTSVTWSNDKGGSGTCTGTTAWSVNGIAMAAGQNLITITAFDAANNTSVAVMTVTYEPVETVAPTVTIASPTSAATYTTADASLDMAGTASDNIGVTSVTWSNDRGGSGACTGTTTWSASGIALSAGQNVIAVTASDAANNKSIAILAVTYEPVETVAPVVAITAPTASPTYATSSTQITISGTASDNVGVTSVSWANSRGGSGTCTGTTSWSASSIALSEGENVITVTASDAAGNHGTAVLTITRAALDTSAPAVSITSPTTAPTYTATTASLNLAGTASDTVGVTSVSWSNDRGGSGTCTGTTSWTASGIALSSGQNVITVTASDAASNHNTAVITVTYSPDTTDPTIYIITPTDQATCARNCATVTLGGTASDNTSVATVTWSNTTTGDSGACKLNAMAWTSAGIDLALGDNTITATATDAAGNTATATITISYMDVTPGAAWNGLAMVSLPIIPDETDPKLEVGFFEDYWLAFLTESNAYAAYPDQAAWLAPADATPGRGFWTYFDSQAAAPRGTIPPQDQPVTIHLTAGWNLVGTPFVSEVTWDVTELMVKGISGTPVPMSNAGNLTPGYAWGWRQDKDDPSKGAYYLVCDTSIAPGAANKLQPWQAYWIQALSDCDLIIPAP